LFISFSVENETKLLYLHIQTNGQIQLNLSNPLTHQPSLPKPNRQLHELAKHIH